MAGSSQLVVREDLAEAVEAAGLGDEATWRTRLYDGPQAAGRGRTARLELTGGPIVVLKQMKRGGVARALWRDRFTGRGRLLANLEVPEEAVERGVPTAAPVAMLILEGPPGLHRGWLATESLSGAWDLAGRVKDGGPSDAEMAAALRATRALHDAGIHHPDLNLGNLLVRPAGDELQGFVVDLDRARLEGDAPLEVSRRRAGLRRLERSLRKLRATASDRPTRDPNVGNEEQWRRWLMAYAGDDASLRNQLLSSRPFDRWTVTVRSALSR